VWNRALEHPPDEPRTRDLAVRIFLRDFGQRSFDG
jgi:hypothetical protein